MHVPRQVVAPKDNKPVMGIVQDSLLGISIFSKRDTFVELAEMMNLLMWLDYDGTLPPPAILKPKPMWTGKQILSLIIPKVNFIRSPNSKTWACPKDNNIFVKNGELMCGTFKKPTVGAAPGGLVHIVWKDCGPQACKDWMSHTQNVVNNWLISHGFTIGVSDIIATPSVVDVI